MLFKAGNKDLYFVIFNIPNHTILLWNEKAVIEFEFLSCILSILSNFAPRYSQPQKYWYRPTGTFHFFLRALNIESARLDLNRENIPRVHDFLYLSTNVRIFSVFMGKSKSTSKNSIKGHIGIKKYQDFCGWLPSKSLNAMNRLNI